MKVIKEVPQPVHIDRPIPQPYPVHIKVAVEKPIAVPVDRVRTVIQQVAVAQPYYRNVAQVRV